MFGNRICKKEGCNNYAISESDFCFSHIDKSEEFLEDVIKKHKNCTELKDFVFCNLTIKNKKIPCRSVITSKFSGSTFIDVEFTEEILKLCFFDFCTFIDCTFSDVEIKYSVFGGSKFENCIFSDSDILHTNLNGSHIKNCKFKSCDLYFSSFIRASIISTSFYDCNLKKVNYSLLAESRDLNFKYCNTEEAIYTGEIPE